MDVVAFDVPLRFDRLSIGPASFRGVAAHWNRIASWPCLACLPISRRTTGVAIMAFKEPISAEILGKNEIYYGDLLYSLEALALARIIGTDVAQFRGIWVGF